MARKLTPRIVSADQAVEILAPASGPPPRLSRPLPPGRLRTRANFADAIARLWAEAEANFIAIGRYLNHAKDTLDHGDFMAMVERDLPFRYSTGNRMMKVAAALDAGLFSLDTMPGSYATAYELLTLNEDERAEAEASGLIRPDVQRKEIAEFKRRLRPARHSGTAAHRRELERRIARLRAELAEAEAELARLTRR